MTLYQEIQRCRICGNQNLDSILDLGNMAFSGVFPKTVEEGVPAGPLTLVKCVESSNGDFCGLVLLKSNRDRCCG